ncbi:MAG: Ger(x)C family spore germination protein [Firmicutes bacterium]|jgi:Ger(x)C family germination protein|nr:Ger(x)C family spore germination protein [Bacillota bacterium]NLL88219.1 Ger(x)C family spore germination protein [Bacillota bacterium]
MRRSRFYPLWILIIASFAASGCWDAKDIDRRTFVMGVAFDLSDTEDQLVMTIEVPVLTSFATQTHRIADTRAFVAATTGTSVAQMAARIETRTWREMFFGHTQCIILGEDLARESILPIIDFFDRNPRIDRRLALFVAQGKADEVLHIKNPLQPLVSVHLNQILNTLTNTTRVVKRNFQDNLRDLESNGDTVLPRVRSTDTELTIAGGALIKDYKFIAWLGENETRAVAFLYNRISGGVLTVNLEDILYTYAIRSASTDIKPVLKDGQLTFRINVKTEGEIIEAFYRGPGGAIEFDIPGIQSKLNQEITDEILHLLTKLQDLRTDPIGFDRLVYRHYPKFWNQHKENWKEQAWPQAKFEVTADFNIRRTGILKEVTIYERQG